MTIHAGILGSLPTDVTSFKLAAVSFAGGIALITVILLINTVVDATTSALRPLRRHKPRSSGPLHDPTALWGTYAPGTRSVLPPFPWARGTAPAVPPAAVNGLRLLGEPQPLAEPAHGPSW